MKVKLWGVRGSIPTPGPNTVKYGGNTTCIEITSDEGDRVILDGGSGIRELGLQLLQELPVECSIFISHTHWDHIQGLPFFVPFFIPGNTVRIYGAFDPVYQKGLQTILAGQMEYCYFPVRSAELKASIEYTDLREGQTVEIGSTSVTPIIMNHPVLCYGYKVESGGKSLFFTGDHEPPPNIYSESDDEYQEYQSLLDEKRKMLHNFLEGIDVLIADSQYTAEEYASKVGWGHSTYDMSIQLAEAVGAKQVFLTHHDPTRPDSKLDEIHEELLSKYDQSAVEISIAIEGHEISL